MAPNGTDEKLKTPLSKSAVEGIVILDCPECGSDPRTHCVIKTFRNNSIEMEGAQAMCKNCGFEIAIKTKDAKRIRAMWNTRKTR
jgi:transcription elongation factor Elf1